MSLLQKSITLKPRPRGFHLVTQDILSAFPEIRTVKVGILFLLLQHTSASLSLNENADSSVRRDFEKFFNEQVPNKAYFEHNYEGEDDMPAHIKSSIMGVQLHIPITEGRLNLGTWQVIYLCEHRDRAGARTIIATLLQ